ncbi:MAG: amphi-Trp domain-containing protein [Dehalococcoidia bacterium]|nr:amphi-Trp domain-containing protein [Dehalococcoidia bacterium]
MQITREVSLKDAVEIIQGFLDHLSDGSVAVGDNEVKLDHMVTIEFEIESSTNELELEFEIKWKVPKPATPAPASSGRASGGSSAGGQSSSSPASEASTPASVGAGS